MDRNTLTLVLSAGPASLDPRIAGDATGVRLVNLIFTSLMRVGSDLELMPDAAESWHLQGHTYTFKLKSGISFANGRPLTTDDLEFSFHEFIKSGTGKDSTFLSIDKTEVKYDAADRWVKIHFKNYSASLLRDLIRVKFLPHAETLTLGADFATHPLGSGPFAFEYQDHATIVLRAREDHPYIKPQMKKVIFKIVRDDNTRLFKLLTGEIDIAQQELPPSKIVTITKNPSFEVVNRPGLSVSYLIFNLRDPVFAHPDFRRALDQAIDRESIVKYKLLGMAVPASSLLAPGNRYHNFAIQPTSFDPSSAAKLLRSLPGLEGQELVLKTSNNPAAIENGRVVANQWNRVLNPFKAHVRTQSYEWGTYYGDIQRGNFQVALMRWTGTLDPNLYRNCFYSTELPPDGKNRGYYKNSKLDPLLDQGLLTPDEKERKKIYDQVQKIVSADRPMLPLWYENEVTVFNRRVKNYEPSLYGDYFALTKVTK